MLDQSRSSLCAGGAGSGDLICSAAGRCTRWDKKQKRTDDMGGGVEQRRGGGVMNE